MLYWAFRPGPPIIAVVEAALLAILILPLFDSIFCIKVCILKSEKRTNAHQPDSEQITVVRLSFLKELHLHQKFKF